MFTFILRRAALIVPTFFGVTLLAFALIHLIPGDPVENLSGERGMDPARRIRLLHEFGLDRPLPVQYADYIGQVLRGDLGTSLTTHEPVLREFLTLFPATVELAFFAMLFAVAVGLPAGIIAALKRNTVADYAVMGVSLTGYSMPIFWWALLLILFFSVQLGWTPVSGRIAVQFDVPASTGFMLIDTLRAGDAGAFRSAVSHLLLPTIALGTIPLAVIARMTRSSMLEVLREDYVRTARAKGSAALAGRAGACVAQRADPGGHRHRAAGRRAAVRAPFSPRRSSPGRASASGWSTACSRATTSSCRAASC